MLKITRTRNRIEDFALTSSGQDRGQWERPQLLRGRIDKRGDQTGLHVLKKSICPGQPGQITVFDKVKTTLTKTVTRRSVRTDTQARYFSLRMAASYNGPAFPESSPTRNEFGGKSNRDRESGEDEKC